MIVSVERAARLLAEAAVVAYPTETVYGLGADAGNPDAVGALLALKGRPSERGLSVLVADLEALERSAPELPEVARRLARRYWPGPLTLVVPLSHPTLECVRSELGVGFRCSPHPTAAALAAELGRPLVATSCNRSGDAPCGSADEVEARFGSALPIAGGEAAGGLPPSTVVAVDTRGHLTLLREGSVSLRELEACAK